MYICMYVCKSYTNILYAYELKHGRNIRVYKLYVCSSYCKAHEEYNCIGEDSNTSRECSMYINAFKL